MTGWKEALINDYVTLSTIIEEHEKALRVDVKYNTLLKQREKIENEIEMYSGRLIDFTDAAEMKRIAIKDQLAEKWDIEDKTFKCDAGSATIRTTRALKVVNKEKLISTLQRICKLTQCIKGWDLTLLRKLTDVGMFNVAPDEGDIVRYDEKHSVVIKGGLGE